MTELDLVEDLCAAVTPPSPERLAPARAQLMAAAHAAQPEAGHASATPERRRLLGGVRLPARGRTRLAIASGLVVVMAAGLSAGLSLAGGGHAPLGAPATAAELLARAAAASAVQPVPRNDQYIYTEATGITPVSLQPGSNKTTQYTTWTWTSVDGKTGSLLHQKPCQRVPGGPDGLGPLTCGDRMSYAGTAFQLPNGEKGVMGGVNILLPKGARPIPEPPQTYAAARALPTTARQLASYLNNFPSLTGYRTPIWEQLTRLLEFVPVLPPKVAAAVFTLASQQPGITLLRHVTDAAGRPGIGISQAGDPFHVQLIFNPATYQLEGINVRSSDPVITPVTPVAGAYSIAILHAAIVNSEPSS